MESSPQSGSPSIKPPDGQSTSNQQSIAYMNMSSTSGSGTKINLQTSGGPPPNVVIPPQHSSNPPSVGSTASQAATPIQPHPPAAAIHAISNSLTMQQNFSPQANNSNSSTVSAGVQQQQQIYAHSYSSTVQQGNATATSYTQDMQQPHPHMEATGGSSLSVTTSNSINFESVSTL